MRSKQKRKAFKVGKMYITPWPLYDGRGGHIEAGSYVVILSYTILGYGTDIEVLGPDGVVMIIHCMWSEVGNWKLAS